MSLDLAHQKERSLLLAYVRAARHALSELSPTEMKAKRLPSAMNEIGMIVETTESAANQIMGAVETILNLPQDIDTRAYRSAVEEHCLTMLEACAFQDLTGQRSTKIVETLMHLEHKLGKLAELLGEDEEQAASEPVPAEGDQVLLNGPAMPGEGIDQDDIDAMFA
jgi:chemotaxis protein CheZ